MSDNWGYKHTLWICHTFYFSMATLVTRTHLSITSVRTLPVVFNDALWKFSGGSPKTSNVLFPMPPISGGRLIYMKVVSLCQFILMIRLPWILRWIWCSGGAATWWGSVNIAECGCIWNTQTISTSSDWETGSFGFIPEMSVIKLVGAHYNRTKICEESVCSDICSRS